MDYGQDFSPLSLPDFAILDALSEGVFTVDTRMRITAINLAACKLIGISRQQVIGRPCSQVFHANNCGHNCSLQASLKQGLMIRDQRAQLESQDGERIPISINTNALRDATGRITGAVESFRDLRLEDALRRVKHPSQGIGDIIAHSDAMRGIIDQLPTIAASQVTVLIQGESGTGKEVIARALHDCSGRRRKPFIALNCGALPDSLLESELFGYVAGAFTDARKDKPGRFALAEGGTLFLDEIGDVSPAMQVRLLRVLQERCYEPLGSVTSLNCDVRIIAASNRHLPSEVAEGRFRRDLYYRLAVIPIHLPPLRQRGDDILRLAEHFLENLAKADGVAVPELDSEVQERLLAWQWPGNVRELANAIERAWVLGHGHIHVQHLPGSGLTNTYYRKQQADLSPPPRSPTPALAPKAAQQQLESEQIMQALADHNWNRSAAASALGMHKTTLHRKLRLLGLKPPRRGSHQSTQTKE
ncbi:MAG: PAS domain-containing protein [Planctomycetota bacterium]|nr:MAG: PAS domain-containing protein [Planctomycetota bacterium]